MKPIKWLWVLCFSLILCACQNSKEITEHTGRIVDEPTENQFPLDVSDLFKSKGDSGEDKGYSTMIQVTDSTVILDDSGEEMAFADLESDMFVEVIFAKPVTMMKDRAEAHEASKITIVE